MAKKRKTGNQPTYHPAPKTLPGFPKAIPVKPKTGMGGGKKRKRWIDPDTGDILEWDRQHGKIERYNDRGKHLGEFDPNDGTETKPAKPGRTVTPTIWTKKRKAKMVFYLTWFQKDGDAFLGEKLLSGVSENDVRRAFDLEPDEYPGDCLDVQPKHVAWLAEKAKGVTVELDSFTYFVEACQD